MLSGSPTKDKLKADARFLTYFFAHTAPKLFSLTKSGNWTGPHFRAEREINFEIVLHAVKLSSRAPRENSITFRPENGLQLCSGSGPRDREGGSRFFSRGLLRSNGISRVQSPAKRGRGQDKKAAKNVRNGSLRSIFRKSRR